jgi:carbohydrate diacid regulator
MFLSAEMAQAIVEETQTIIQHNVNFMDASGTIIASMDPDRIGDFHEGAWEVLQTGRKVIITEGDERIGAKPGINLPVCFNREVIGVIGITGSLSEVVKLCEMIQRMTEILVKEAYLKKQTDLEQRAQESFIEAWLTGAIPCENKKLFASRGWIMGINVHIPRVVAMIDLIGFDDFVYEELKSHQADVTGELKVQQTRRQILQAIKRLVPDRSQDLAILTGSSTYTLLLTIDESMQEESLRQQLKVKLEKMKAAIQQSHGWAVAIGVGRYHGESVEKSLQEAKRALTFAASGHLQSIVFYDQLGIESMMDEISSETRRDFVTRTLFIPADEDRKELLETLRTFFACNQSLNQAADALYIHKNTLQYRLKKIRDLTGLDPRHFTDAVQLYMALILMDIKSSKGH